MLEDARFFQKWAEGLIPGGLAEKENVKPSQVDQKELSEGVKVEVEHTPDKAKAEEIATDHLTEIPDYYERLEEMEEEAKEDEANKPSPTSKAVIQFLANSKKAPTDDETDLA